jgi:diguanylate cyclase
MPVSLEHADPPARILIVDDGPDNREVLEIILRFEGFLTLSAASGEEALAMLIHQPVDLVLLDVMMPGIDGHEVVARIRGNLATKDLLVIMVSALTDRNARATALSAGADDVLAKPLSRAELVSLVRDLLAARKVVSYA